MEIIKIIVNEFPDHCSNCWFWNGHLYCNAKEACHTKRPDDCPLEIEDESEKFVLKPLSSRTIDVVIENIENRNIKIIKEDF